MMLPIDLLLRCGHAVRDVTGTVSQWYPWKQPGSLVTHFTIISNESENEGLMHLGGGLHLSQRRLSREETSQLSVNKTLIQRSLKIVKAKRF